MASPIKCVKGHWYQPDPSGRATSCPRCKAASSPQNAKAISEDDVMAFLNDPTGGDRANSPSQEPEPSQKLHKGALKRHKKVCRECHSETSFAFEYCPRCGGPLQVAMIDVS
jgi:hypothetical protein